MDGGIRLTEAAQGFLFAGPAEKGWGALDTPSSSAACAPLILHVPYLSEAGSSTIWYRSLSQFSLLPP